MIGTVLDIVATCTALVLVRFGYRSLVSVCRLPIISRVGHHLKDTLIIVSLVIGAFIIVKQALHWSISLFWAVYDINAQFGGTLMSQLVVTSAVLILVRFGSHSLVFARQLCVDSKVAERLAVTIGCAAVAIGAFILVKHAFYLSSGIFWTMYSVNEQLSGTIISQIGAAGAVLVLVRFGYRSLVSVCRLPIISRVGHHLKDTLIIVSLVIGAFIIVKQALHWSISLFWAVYDINAQFGGTLMSQLVVTSAVLILVRFGSHSLVFARQLCVDSKVAERLAVTIGCAAVAIGAFILVKHAFYLSSGIFWTMYSVNEQLSDTIISRVGTTCGALLLERFGWSAYLASVRWLSFGSQWTRLLFNVVRASAAAIAVVGGFMIVNRPILIFRSLFWTDCIGSVIVASLTLYLLYRLLARFRPQSIPPTCPICLDPVCTSGPNDAITLACGHALCRDCVAPYVATKVRDRHLESDQLTCPVLECRRAMGDRDLRRILTADSYAEYTRTLQRVRDEANPLARWCPRRQCGELIMCESTHVMTFTCPKCATVGCFHCREGAHSAGFLCWIGVKKEDAPYLFGRFQRANSDASFARWEKNLGRAVRACPKCQMRIWKSDGCNHMTCTQCRHEYCWVCDADWQGRHYNCKDEPITETRRASSSAAPVESSAVPLRIVAREVLLVVVSTAILFGAWINRTIVKPVCAGVTSGLALLRLLQRTARVAVVCGAWINRKMLRPVRACAGSGLVLLRPLRPVASLALRLVRTVANTGLRWLGLLVGFVLGTAYRWFQRPLAVPKQLTPTSASTAAPPARSDPAASDIRAASPTRATSRAH